ncbi:hypothetical protein [Gordonia sihwensis]|uniref:hypothetical protein n=1 Tax=Gordonia sihwensis TaxID=173559 RepID=UPI0024164300|nr:hypothetical protein [Gordonia sihwensis]WFN94133.1 hypothetical protein P5P27_06195 [Gordonia sihwensis]WFN94194.1 hypothetical protein P5P27_06505 [Gordonia sihwensis]
MSDDLTFFLLLAAASVLAGIAYALTMWLLRAIADDRRDDGPADWHPMLVHDGDLRESKEVF